MNIIEAIDDKRLLGPLFRDPESWRAWRVFLKAIFALEMSPEERELYRRFTDREKPPAEPSKEVFCIAGRRSGKSFMSALIACYLACFRKWDSYLGPGEEGYILIIGSDKRQCRVVLSYLKGILSLPVLKPMVERFLVSEVNLKNRITIEIKSASFRFLRGYTLVAAILDELAFWRIEGANPSQEILRAIRPALSTIPGSLLLGISTPYGRFGVLYEAFRDKFGKDDREMLIWRAATREMNPTIREAIISRALTEDLAAGRSEWLAEFREDIETYLTLQAIEGAVYPGRIELPPGREIAYFAFADPSGGRADSFAVAIAHKTRQEKIIIDKAFEIAPPFKPLDAVKKIADLLKPFRIREITGDRYAGEWVKTAFEDIGIGFNWSERDKSEIYLEFEAMVNQGAVELPDHRKLVSELRSLERRTRSGGKDLIDHAPGLHDDLANAVAGASILARGEDSARGFYISQSKFDAY